MDDLGRCTVDLLDFMEVRAEGAVEVPAQVRVEGDGRPVRLDDRQRVPGLGVSEHASAYQAHVATDGAVVRDFVHVVEPIVGHIGKPLHGVPVDLAAVGDLDAPAEYHKVAVGCGIVAVQAIPGRGDGPVAHVKGSVFGPAPRRLTIGGAERGGDPRER